MCAVLRTDMINIWACSVTWVCNSKYSLWYSCARSTTASVVMNISSHINLKKIPRVHMKQYMEWTVLCLVALKAFFSHFSFHSTVTVRLGAYTSGSQRTGGIPLWPAIRIIREHCHMLYSWGIHTHMPFPRGLSARWQTIMDAKYSFIGPLFCILLWGH